MARLRLLITQAYLHYSLSLAASGSRHGREVFDELTHPRVGDLVLEISTIYNCHLDAHRLGKLLRIEAKPLYPPENWLGEPDEVPTEPAYVIKSLQDDEEHVWTNARFIKVITKRSR